MNTFEMKTAIHFGADALGRLRDIPYKRVLVITDPFVVKSGMIDMITKPLQAGGKEFDIFCDDRLDIPQLSCHGKSSLIKFCAVYHQNTHFSGIDHGFFGCSKGFFGFHDPHILV